MKSWSVVFKESPVSTPRPSFAVRNTKNGLRVITYYGGKHGKRYNRYLENIKKYIEENGLYNKNFWDNVTADEGVIANITFYLPVSKRIRFINSFLHTARPDIDNLIKGVLDGIFNGLNIRDSRVVGIKALKVKTFSDPRVEVTLTGLGEKVDSGIENKKLRKLIANNTLKWQTIIPYSPLAAPRPEYRVIEDGIDSKGNKKYKKYVYNPTNYNKYLLNIEKYLKNNNLYNETLYKIVNSTDGVLANINFFCKVPKNQKNIRKLMKTTTPDIDNLLKAVLDGIFNSLRVEDSRVVGVQALKFNELNNPRTEVELIGLGEN